MRSLLIYFIIIALAACSKSELLMYGGDSDVYFSYKLRSVQTDSINITFGKSDTMQTSIAEFNVNMIGKQTAENRTYSIVVDEKLSTAVAGKHYLLPVADSLYIRGNTSGDTVRIQAMRTADIRDTSVVLYLKLVPDRHFTTGMGAYNYASATVVSATSLRIVIDDILLQPANWAGSEAFLGKFSREKIMLMVKQLSLVMTSFYPAPGGSSYSATNLSNFSKSMQKYLNEQAALGNVIREKNGSPMVMGPSAQ